MSNATQRRFLTKLEYVRETAIPAVQEAAAAARREVSRFRRYVAGHIRRAARKYLRDFRAIGACSEINQPAIRRQAVLLARARIVNDRIGGVTTVLLLLAIPGVPFLMVQLAETPVVRELGVAALTKGDGVVVMGTMLLMLFLMFPPLPSGPFVNLVVGSRSFRALWAAVVFVMALSGGVLALPWHPDVALCLITPCVFVVFVNALIVTQQYLSGLVAAAYPEQYPLERLLEARRNLAPHSRRLTSIGGRVDAARELEMAALHIRRAWPREASGLDAAGRTWYRQQCRNVATHFVAARQDLMWAAPYDDTARVTVDKLIRLFLEGNVKVLASVPNEQSAGDVAHANVRRFVNIGVGVLPLAVLGLLKALNLPLPASITPWATLFACIWALVALLSAVDPLLERRILLSRGVLDLIKPKLF